MGYDRGDSFPFDFNQMEIYSVKNRKENCHQDRIPLNLKGNGILVFSVYKVTRLRDIPETHRIIHCNMVPWGIKWVPNIVPKALRGIPTTGPDYSDREALASQMAGALSSSAAGSQV